MVQPLVTWLLTSDLHLSDRPKDSYRFGLFPWLAQQQKQHKVTATFILGDLTETKDRHSAGLVNRVIEELIHLTSPVYIQMGNHDYIDPNNPFFKFLNCIEGIHFVTKPTILQHLGVVIIPHCKDQAEFERACGIEVPKSPTYLVHQTFTGATAESGTRLTGLSWPLKGVRAFAGDVHVPQKCQSVTYVGAPYSIRFGDQFTPRVLLVNGEREQDLHFPCLRKWTLHVRDPDELLEDKRLSAGDHVKITIELAREEVVTWTEYKQRALAVCKELGLEVFGIELKMSGGKRKRLSLTQVQAKTNEDVLEAYCNRENAASAIRQAGIELLK